MNNKIELQEIIKKIVVNSLETDEVDIQFNSDLREFGMDSMNCIKIIVAIEDAYEFEFADEDLVLENFITIENLADYVNRRLTNTVA